MYIALALTFCGILAGRLCRAYLPAKLLANMTFAAVLCLLLLLGVQVGANEFLFANLDGLGWKALILTVLAMAGSVLAAIGLQKLITRRGARA